MHLYRTERVCPECGSHDVARSRRRGAFESFLKTVLRLRPYRCRKCAHRFFGYMGAERGEDHDHGQRAA